MWIWLFWKIFLQNLLYRSCILKKCSFYKLGDYKDLGCNKIACFNHFGIMMIGTYYDVMGHPECSDLPDGIVG